MATTTTTIVQQADSPTLKRAFASDLVPNTFVPSKKCDCTFSQPPSQSRHSSRPPSWSNNPGNRSPRPGQRPTRSIRRPSMVQTSARTFSPPMPSFMSVFGEEDNNVGVKDLAGRSGTTSHGSNLSRPASSGNILTGSHSASTSFSTFHVHRDSTSTLASESSDSSPTTTISTMDSSSVTDPSPGPSPESPVAKAAPSSFVPDFRSRRADNGSSESSPNPFFELQRPTTPAKKARNLKNLGINTASSLSNLRSNTIAPLAPTEKKEKNTSAPTSPSFIKPPTPPKRRPSNLSLTIQTPGGDSKPMRLIIPSTPALNRPALRHFQSSPSLPLCSPSVAPVAGMQLPPLRPIKTNPHGFAEIPIEMEEEDQEPNFDIPQSREEKPAAYPNGPICIYESGVYLYFEPTAEQASTFDVIVNVASEVKNPFTTQASDSQKDLDARRIDGPPAENVDFNSLPDRVKTSSFDTQGSSPTTPKATPVLATTEPSEHIVNGTIFKTPEYIHMPWEHNTDIVPDLLNLVKTMDDRVQQGKRVLVHCQCGVSRSASLIVAYGLYKNPGISVQEAYDAVKKRSKWIGPNMSLIMQLQEFRNNLLRMNEPRIHTGFPRRSAGLQTGVSAAVNIRSPFERDAASGSRTPRTAPLPPETDMNLQRASTGNMISISPGPLSAPSGTFFSPGYRRSWDASQTNFELSPKSSPAHSPAPYVDPTGHVIPVLSINDENQFSNQTQGPRGEVNNTSRIDIDLKSPAVPNFSRQLPLRTLVDDSTMEDAQLPESTTSKPHLFAPLELSAASAMRSPLASHFPSQSFGAKHHETSSGSTSLAVSLSDSSPWLNPDKSSHSNPPETPTEQPLMSPRSTEFHMTPLKSGEIDESHGLLSPRATSFELNRPLITPPKFNDNVEDFGVSSPTRTEFPRDPFVQSSDIFDLEITSPRASEFHMTPLKPRVADEDPFGLTSPTRFDFPSSSFENSGLTPPHNPAVEARRPSFQAILPPSHLEQPATVNGFASLDGTAQAPPAIALSNFVPTNPSSQSSEASRIDSLNSSLETPQTTTATSTTPSSSTPSESTTPLPFSQKESFLSTPSRPTGIRTRFSSPNMREQRKLHKLQTEMEALLPHRSSQAPQAADDLDALMSPRAEEFTRNPFHFNLRSPVDDPSPASSTETIKECHSHSGWKDASQLTPQKAVEDPRSPVQTGSSPITRNIWDVL